MVKRIIKLLLIAVLGCIFFSCAPTKKSAYFQKQVKDIEINIPDKIYYLEHDSSIIIQGGDELYISVTSGNGESNSFDQPAGVGGAGVELLGYPVDNNGYIRLPYLKNVYAEGLSINQLADTLETKLSQYIYLPAVNIHIVNSRVTILGEVNGAGQFVFNRNSLNIYQAIAMAGDIGNYGNRKKVLIVRQEGNSILKKYVDLTNDEIITSIWFQIQPNDIIYVEPLARRNLGMETFSIFDLFGLITSTYAMYILLSGF